MRDFIVKTRFSNVIVSLVILMIIAVVGLSCRGRNRRHRRQRLNQGVHDCRIPLFSGALLQDINCLLATETGPAGYDGSSVPHQLPADR